MARREIQGCRTIVTGASAGIGRAIALELVRQGARVVAVARREEKLRELVEETQPLIEAGPGEIKTLAGDVTDSATREAAIAVATNAWDGLDAVVNNAGIGAFGRFADAEPDRLRRIMEVNFFAAAELTRSAVPLLTESKCGIVVNLGSILGHRAVPQASEYCASKFAIRGLSESLRVELASRGIDLLLVSPGTTETEFYDNVIEGQGAAPWESRTGVPAKVVARQTVAAMRKGKREIIPSPSGRWMVRAGRWFPGILDRVLRRYS